MGIRGYRFGLKVSQSASPIATAIAAQKKPCLAAAPGECREIMESVMANSATPVIAQLLRIEQFLALGDAGSDMGLQYGIDGRGMHAMIMA